MREASVHFNFTAMELVLSEEQRMLRESARAFVKSTGGPNAYRRLLAQDLSFDRKRLEALGADGWLRILVSPAKGGLGLGLTEFALIMEAAGEGLITEPVAELTVAAWAISTGRAATGLGSTLDKLINGSLVVIPAIRDIETSATQAARILSTNEHHGYQLTGETPIIPYSDQGDIFLIDAATQEGTLIYAVRREGSGLVAHFAPRKDGILSGKLVFPGVFVVEDALVASRDQGPRMAASIYDRVLIGHVAEMLGVMEGAMALTLGYVQTREQFDRPIGSFQAIQHRMVDDALAIETTRSLLFQTCKAFDDGRAQRAMVAALKAYASEAVMQVTKSSIQLHGAIGFTEEHDIGLFLKRALGLSVQYGTASDHRRRFQILSEERKADPAADQSREGRRPRKKRRRSVFSGISGG